MTEPKRWTVIVDAHGYPDVMEHASGSLVEFADFDRLREELRAADENIEARDRIIQKRGEEIDRLEAERDEARLETWRIVHKCPSCGRWFDSPSVCLGEPPRAWWRRPFRRDRHPAGAHTVECLVRVPRPGSSEPR